MPFGCGRPDVVGDGSPGTKEPQPSGLQLQPVAVDTQMAGLLQQAAAQQTYMYMQQRVQQGGGGLPGFKLLQPGGGGGLKRGRSQASLEENLRALQVRKQGAQNEPCRTALPPQRSRRRASS